jgi:hypothetical protein
VPAGHIVHFILEALEQLPITGFRVNERGAIPAQDDAGVVDLLLRNGPLWFPLGSFLGLTHGYA